MALAIRPPGGRTPEIPQEEDQPQNRDDQHVAQREPHEAQRQPRRRRGDRRLGWERQSSTWVARFLPWPPCCRRLSPVRAWLPGDQLSDAVARLPDAL